MGAAHASSRPRERPAAPNRPPSATADYAEPGTGVSHPAPVLQTCKTPRSRVNFLPFSYAFRNLGRGPVRLAASLAGAALVTLLLLASVGFVRGMQRTLSGVTPLHENVLLLGAGSEQSLERSQLDASVATIAAAGIPGIRTAGGVAFVSPEINAALPLHTSADPPGGDAQGHPAVLRGVTEAALLVHPAVEVTEGRVPVAGADELMAGALAATRMGLPEKALAVGEALYLDGRPFEVVGRFAATRTVMDAELWVPLPDLQVAINREATLSSVVVGLEPGPGGGRFADADLFAKSRLDLELVALREADYHASLDRFYRPIRVVVFVTAALIGLGGLLGGLNTTYAAFAQRVREIGTLQALGFSRRAVVLSLTQESLFAAACGTAIGLALGHLLLGSVAVRFSMGAFELSLDAVTVLSALAAGLGLGLVGALPPALACLRLPVAVALKSH